MAGLFYYDDIEGITLFWFSPDGRVISMVKCNLFDQHLQTYTWFKIDSEKVQFSRGIYHVDIWDNIRICTKGDYGKLVYDGYIRDDYIDLYHRCPITNFKKLVTYVRFGEEKDINHFEFDQSILN